MDPDPKNGAEKVNEKREDLEELADSDNSASWVAEELLEAASEYGEQ